MSGKKNDLPSPLASRRIFVWPSLQIGLYTLALVLLPFLGTKTIHIQYSFSVTSRKLIAVLTSLPQIVIHVAHASVWLLLLAAICILFFSKTGARLTDEDAYRIRFAFAALFIMPLFVFGFFNAFIGSIHAFLFLLTVLSLCSIHNKHSVALIAVCCGIGIYLYHGFYLLYMPAILWMWYAQETASAKKPAVRPIKTVLALCSALFAFFAVFTPQISRHIETYPYDPDNVWKQRIASLLESDFVDGIRFWSVSDALCETLFFVLLSLPFLIFLTLFWIRTIRVCSQTRSFQKYKSIFRAGFCLLWPTIPAFVWFRSIGVWLLSVAFVHTLLIALLVKSANPVAIDVLGQMSSVRFRCILLMLGLVIVWYAAAFHAYGFFREYFITRNLLSLQGIGG